MNNPLVSIITPNYNTFDFLPQTIESVLSQTYSNWEMIIVDDASTDNSVQIIKEYMQKDDRIKAVFLEKNNGQGNARNIATDRAQGKYIAFLDSDDLWHSQKLEKHIKFMIVHNALFSHTGYGFVDEKGESILRTFQVSNSPTTYKMLLKRAEISCLTAIYKVSIGKRYMPNLKRKQDYALWLSILKEGIKSYPLNEELAYYRQRKGSITNNKFKLILDHFVFLRKIEKLNIFQSLRYTMYWGINGFIKYYINR